MSGEQFLPDPAKEAAAKLAKAREAVQETLRSKERRFEISTDTLAGRVVRDLASYRETLRNGHEVVSVSEDPVTGEMSVPVDTRVVTAESVKDEFEKREHLFELNSKRCSLFLLCMSQSIP